jgi:hypothetical protein
MGLQNENDLLQQKLAGAAPAELPQRILSLLHQAGPVDAMSGYNKERFPEQTRGFQALWKEGLSVVATPIDEARPATSAQPDTAESPLQRATQTLLQRLTALKGREPVLVCRYLSDFVRASGAHDLKRGLKALEPGQASALLELLTAATETRELRSDEPKRWNWNEDPLYSVRSNLADRVVLRFVAPLAQEGALESAVHKLLTAVRSPWAVVLLDRQRDATPGQERVSRSVLLAGPGANRNEARPETKQAPR